MLQQLLVKNTVGSLLPMCGSEIIRPLPLLKALSVNWGWVKVGSKRSF